MMDYQELAPHGLDRMVMRHEMAVTMDRLEEAVRVLEAGGADYDAAERLDRINWSLADFAHHSWYSDHRDRLEDLCRRYGRALQGPDADEAAVEAALEVLLRQFSDIAVFVRPDAGRDDPLIYQPLAELYLVLSNNRRNRADRAARRQLNTLAEGFERALDRVDAPSRTKDDLGALEIAITDFLRRRDRRVKDKVITLAEAVQMVLEALMRSLGVPRGRSVALSAVSYMLERSEQ